MKKISKILNLFLSIFRKHIKEETKCSICGKEIIPKDGEIFGYIEVDTLRVFCPECIKKVVKKTRRNGYKGDENVE